MNARLTALLAVTVLTCAGAGAAEAAAKKPKPKPAAPVCNLVQDGPGDGRGLNGANDQLDILSADIASDAAHLTAVLRLKAAPAADDQNSPVGKLYTVGFTAGKAGDVFLQARLTKAGGAAYSANSGTAAKFNTGSATGAFTGTEVRISVPLSSLVIAGALKPGSSFSALNAGSRVLTLTTAGVPGEQDSLSGTTAGDDASADGKKTYTAGAASCVTP